MGVGVTDLIVSSAIALASVCVMAVVFAQMFPGAL